MAAIDRRIIYHFDWTVFTVALGLASIGLLSVFSATWGGAHQGLDPLVVRQLLWIGVGVVLMGGAALFDYRTLATYAYPIYVVAILLLVTGTVWLRFEARYFARVWESIAGGLEGRA